MGTFKNVVAGVAGLVVTSVGTWNTLDVVLQSGTPSQPGQPAKQPRPSNPQPRPNTPQPRQQDPTPSPDNAPNRNEQPDRPRDTTPGDREAERGATAGRYARPFAFQSPGAEGQFNLATRRLMQMEQRMQRSQEELLRSLGEARRLTGTRQNEALFDVLQGMLREQAELQRYLIQARTAWTGDLTPVDQSDGENVDENIEEGAAPDARSPR